MNPTERFVLTRGGYVEQPPDLEYLPTATTLTQTIERELDAKPWAAGVVPGEVALAVDGSKTVGALNEEKIRALVLPEHMLRRPVFVLGAGFSTAVNRMMPVMKALYDGVTRNMEGADRDTFEALVPDALRRDQDLEKCLSFLDQAPAWLDREDADQARTTARKVRGLIAVQIQACTESTVHQGCEPWLRELVEAWTRTKCTVITLNYDTLIETARRKQKEVEGYEWNWETIYPAYLLPARNRAGQEWGRPDNPNMTLLKLHGSTNWYHSGDDADCGDTIYFSDGHGDDGGNRCDSPLVRDKTALIVPPVYDKSRHLRNSSLAQVWRDAARALRGATDVNVIGYSLPDSDLAMMSLLRRREAQPHVNLRPLGEDHGTPHPVEHCGSGPVASGKVPAPAGDRGAEHKRAPGCPGVRQRLDKGQPTDKLRVAPNTLNERGGRE